MTLAALKKLEYAATQRRKGFEEIVATALSERSAPEAAEPIYRELGASGSAIREAMSNRRRNFEAMQEAANRRGQT